MGGWEGGEGPHSTDMREHVCMCACNHLYTQEEARKLSESLGHRVLLKREDLQPVFSFKLRGAYNKVGLLPLLLLLFAASLTQAGPAMILSQS